MKIKTKYNVTMIVKNVCNFGYTLAAILLMLFASACSIGGKSNPSHFYVLDSQIENIANKKFSNLRMRVGPIIIPGYIDRPQIVTKTESAELKLAEFDRWAEPMEGMFTRALAQNIKTISGSHLIHSYPWPSNIEFDYRISANVVKFENNTNGDALLAVHWQLINSNDHTILKNVHSEFSASAKDTSYTARVAALNDTLAQFAEEIVNHIE
jgi:uncharacterized lipoprotein YmbA